MSRVIKNHKLTSFQWGFLLAIYIFSYGFYLINDISYDGVIDQNGHIPMLILVVIASVGTLWYGLARNAHIYTR